MSVSHPLALWAMAAATIPVLLHLLARVRPRPLVFPGTYLLRRMDAQRLALRLRHLLLLAMRVAAIAAAGLAAAGLTLHRPIPLLSGRAAPILVLDASASMSARLRSGGPAREVVERLDAEGRARGASIVVLPASRQKNAAHEPATWLQGAVGDWVRREAETKTTATTQPMVILTDMDASTLLPRRWPPQPADVAATVVDCGSEAGAAVYSARMEPVDPPSGAPVEVTIRTAAAKEGVVRVGAGSTLTAAVEAGPGIGVARVALGPLPPGRRILHISGEAGEAYRLVVEVRENLRVRLEARGEARNYLEAAVDPRGRGRPLSLAAGQAADVVVGVCEGPPPAAIRQMLGTAGLLLFCTGAGGVEEWLRAALDGDAGLRAGEQRRFAPDQAARLIVPHDVRPPMRGLAERFRAAFGQCRVFRALDLQASAQWRCLARFDYGLPAVLWRDVGGRGIVVFAFAPVPEATDLVASGAFAALVHALVPQIAPLARELPGSLPIGAAAWSACARADPQRPEVVATRLGEVAANPPPAELACVRVGADELTRVWGPGVEVVEADEATLPAMRPGPSDLALLLALILMVLAGGEWLLGASLSWREEDTAGAGR